MKYYILKLLTLNDDVVSEHKITAKSELAAKIECTNMLKTIENVSELKVYLFASNETFEKSDFYLSRDDNGKWVNKDKKSTKILSNNNSLNDEYKRERRSSKSNCIIPQSSSRVYLDSEEFIQGWTVKWVGHNWGAIYMININSSPSFAMDVDMSNKILWLPISLKSSVNLIIKYLDNDALDGNQKDKLSIHKYKGNHKFVVWKFNNYDVVYAA